MNRKIAFGAALLALGLAACGQQENQSETVAAPVETVPAVTAPVAEAPATETPVDVTSESTVEFDELPIEATEPAMDGTTGEMPAEEVPVEEPPVE